MRLIDADKLIDYFYYGINDIPVIDGYNDRKIIDIIKEQPTSYDVNKVAKRLEEMRDTITHNISLNSQGENVDEEILNEISHYQKIIKIVKSGGIE